MTRDEQTMTEYRLLAEEDPKLAFRVHTTVPIIPTATVSQRFQHVHVIVSAMFD